MTTESSLIKSQQLKKLINIVSTKTIYSVIVINSPNDQGIITQNLNSPLEFNPELNYMCSLRSFSASSLFPNMYEQNNKFYYSVTEPVHGTICVRDVMETLTFNTGAYNIKDINDYLKDHITSASGPGEKITIELNAGSGKSIIKLKDNAKVYFGQYRNSANEQKDYENTFSNLLGFNKVTLTPAVNTSQHMVNIIQDLVFFISVDCIDGSNFNGKYTQILYSFLNNQKY